MTQALDAAAQAFYEAWVHYRDVALPYWYQLRDVEPGALGKNVWRLGARSALRAALPAEPTPEVIEEMAKADAEVTGDWEWDHFPNRDKTVYRHAASAAYRALRAHLLGEDA